MCMALKIGVDIRALDTPFTTGVDSYLRNILAVWLKAGNNHQFKLFGTKRLSADKLVQDFVAAGHKFFGQPLPSKIFNGSMRFLTRPKMDEVVGGVDIFFFPNPMFHALSVFVPSVLTVHDLSAERFQPIYSLKRNLWHKLVDTRREAQRAKAIIAVSGSTARDLGDLYKIDSQKIHVVPLGVSQVNQMTERAMKLPNDYILYIGSVEPRKNVLALLKAFELLQNKFSDLHLVLAGSFFPQKDRAALGAAFRTKNVLILGQVGDAEKRELYQRAKICVLPSFYEGFGLPIIEAQSLGTPVIASTNSSMPETSGCAAILVNPLNVTELKQALDVLLTNQALRDTLIGRGREWASRFTWQKTADATLNILEQAAIGFRN